MFGLVGKEIVFIVVLSMVYSTVIRGNWTNCFLQTVAMLFSSEYEMKRETLDISSCWYHMALALNKPSWSGTEDRPSSIYLKPL